MKFKIMAIGAFLYAPNRGIDSSQNEDGSFSPRVNPGKMGFKFHLQDVENKDHQRVVRAYLSNPSGPKATFNYIIEKWLMDLGEIKEVRQKKGSTILETEDGEIDLSDFLSVEVGDVISLKTIRYGNHLDWSDYQRVFDEEVLKTIRHQSTFVPKSIQKLGDAVDLPGA